MQPCCILISKKLLVSTKLQWDLMLSWGQHIVRAETVMQLLG